MGKMFKDCIQCGLTLPNESYLPVNSIFFADGVTPICKDCIAKLLRAHPYDIGFADKLCQWTDIPFRVDDWIDLYEINQENTFTLYSQMFKERQFDSTDWKETNEHYMQAKNEGALDKEISLLGAEELKNLKTKWGKSYIDEELYYLENLYQGILNTQNVVGDIQLDNAKKLCKISLIIDNKIRAEEDFKDELASYEKLVKICDFTPKNIKNASDFSSVGELFAFLEKKGWENPFYDGVERDIIDNTMKNIQIYNRNLYVNESGISEEIDRKIEGLKIAQQIEEEHDMVLGDDLDRMEVEGYTLDEDFEEDI